MKAIRGTVKKGLGGLWVVEGSGLDEFENGARVIVVELDVISELVEDDVTICEGCSRLFKYDCMYGDEEGCMFCDDCWYNMLDEAIAASEIEIGDEEPHGEEDPQ